MGFSNVVIPREVVSISENSSFEVRGLSFDDVSRIVVKHAAVASGLFAQFMARVEGQGDDLATIDLKSIGKDLIGDAPAVVIDIILLAGDSENESDRKVVQSLPVPVQMDALNRIGRLTFTSEEALGKMLEMVIGTMDSAMRAGQSLNRPSLNGAGSSASA